MKNIYLDNNSTTPVLPEVARAMAECYALGLANPASAHQPGQQARRVLEDTRERIGRILGADVTTSAADRVIFTSGATEANNLALRGLAGSPGHAIVSSIEHPSVLGPAGWLKQQGWRVDYLGVSGDGVVWVDQLADMLREDTRLVSVMLGNNETGVLQPITRIAAICRQAGVPLHSDASQVVGKLPVHFGELGVDALTATAHKFHGPRGIGVLVVKADLPLRPILFGGFQQGSLRPGTESIAPAVGMLAALELWAADPDARAAQLTELRDSLEVALLAGWPELVINGCGAPRLPHTSNVSFPGLDRQAILMGLDVAGVAASTGSTCASGSSEPSPVLLAMGCDKRVVDGSLRLSVGATTTAQDVEVGAKRILEVANGLSGGPRRSSG